MMAGDDPFEARVVLADGVERPVPATGLVIGRRIDTDLMIDDSSVSRRHAQIVRRGGAWYVADLGSRNGTTLNGQPVAREVRLFDADVLQLGDAILTFRLGAPQLGHPVPLPATGVPAPNESLGPVVLVAEPEGARSTEPMARGAPPRLQITVSEPLPSDPGPAVQLQMRGVLDIETADQLRSRTAELLQTGVVHYLLDLRDLEYLDSSGLAALVALRRQVNPRGGTVRLQHLQPAVRSIIELTHLDRILTVE